MTKLVCVVGGSGFIGTRLCQRFNKNENINFTIVDKAASATFSDRVKIADVRSPEALRNAIGPDSVLINLAAEHRDDVRPLSLYEDVNVLGAKNLCAVAREKNVNFIVFTSTVAVYGFAPLDTDETGAISPFNEYGRTKYEAEKVFKAWQAEDASSRTLVIVRPTVVFGEQNRGNVFNLLRQIASGRFIMVGDGENRKSMAYVENITAFLEYALAFKPGVHIYNYIDKPDLSMNMLVGTVRRMFGKPEGSGFRLPYVVGLAIGKGFDLAAVPHKRYSRQEVLFKFHVWYQCAALRFCRTCATA
jgi:nucleoside-diphosphate-sugar epimerase